MLIFSIIAFRATAVFGDMGSILSATPFQTVRVIDIGNVLTRIELLIAIAITLALFVKICVLYYATVKGIAQLFPIRTQNLLIIPVGAIAIVLAQFSFLSDVLHTEFFRKYDLFFCAPCNVVIPIVTLLVAMMRKLPKASRENSIYRNLV